MANYYELTIASEHKEKIDDMLELLSKYHPLIDSNNLEWGVIERCEHGTNLNLDFPCTEVEESKEHDCN